MKKIVVLLVVLSHLFFCAASYCNDEEVIDYATLFETDVAKNPDILWKVFVDEEQDASKLLKDRNVRAIFVGLYDDFTKQFNKSSYPRLSVYMSPFQVKILFIDYYMNKLIKLKDFGDSNKTYLTIHDFKKDYSNLYPHLYKRGEAKRKSIIPNKLFKIDFFKSEKYIQAYQDLFDGITEAVEIEDVQNEKLMPKLLDESRKIKLTEKNKFNFFKVSAVINEVLVKKSFEYFFDQIKELIDIIKLTKFYKVKYFPKMDYRNFTPLRERIISANVLYNPNAH
jgi:hypothetical protein